MSGVLWSLPLHGVPCTVCGQPAAGMVVREDLRVVLHPDGAGCPLPNPVAGLADPTGACERCGRQIALFPNGGRRPHKVEPGAPWCQPTSRGVRPIGIVGSPCVASGREAMAS